jgi:hypothetical protein
MSGIRTRLSGGDRRPIGAAGDLAAQARDAPGTPPALAPGLDHPASVVRMRRADAAKKPPRNCRAPRLIVLRRMLRGCPPSPNAAANLDSMSAGAWRKSSRACR